MNFMTRNGSHKQPPTLPPQKVSAAVAAHLDHVTNIEAALSDAQEVILEQREEIDQLRRELAVERRERQAAQAARDEFHTRAIASETAVNNAAAILLDEVKRGREFAAQKQPAKPDTTGPIAVDLDQLATSINAEVAEGK